MFVIIGTAEVFNFLKNEIAICVTRLKSVASSPERDSYPHGEKLSAGDSQG